MDGSALSIKEARWSLTPALKSSSAAVTLRGDREDGGGGTVTVATPPRAGEGGHGRPFRPSPPKVGDRSATCRLRPPPFWSSSEHRRRPITPSQCPIHGLAKP
ncbi:hypothetical protein E2562_023344 [Oryza meyeriana var. granulata]|uniref:Uncharacterized protein n=1 Tax=Oryza meyeriana var. granulata TaxID=110450 RepID=A0A6G1E197_9ORYZ|nr:hypothetical protein E2562_023344 [Oryza meyeriana var. granulata]